MSSLRRTLVLAALALALALPVAAGAGAPAGAPAPRWKPVAFSHASGIKLVHESNMFGVQRRHESAFDTDADPYERFHRMKGPSDTATRLRFDASWRWKHASKRFIELGVSARREDWFRNELAGNSRLALGADFGVTRDDTIKLDVSWTPEHFRKNSKVEAFPGIVVFQRSDATKHGMRLAWSRDWNKKWSTTVGYGVRRRDFTEPFDGRDLRREEMRVAVDWKPTKRAAFGLAIARRQGRTDASVEAGIAKDRSRDEDRLDLDARIKLPREWRLEPALSWQTRDYTTDNPDDTSRFDRTDRRFTAGLKAEKRLGDAWRLSFGVSHRDHDSGRHSPTRPSRDYDSENLKAFVAIGFSR